MTEEYNTLEKISKLENMDDVLEKIKKMEQTKTPLEPYDEIKF